VAKATATKFDYLRPDIVRAMLAFLNDGKVDTKLDSGKVNWKSRETVPIRANWQPPCNNHTAVAIEINL
jgi:hypothetical protein